MWSDGVSVQYNGTVFISHTALRMHFDVSDVSWENLSDLSRVLFPQDFSTGISATAHSPVLSG